MLSDDLFLDENNNTSAQITVADGDSLKLGVLQLLGGGGGTYSRVTT